jgi:hypothetical protein
MTLLVVTFLMKAILCGLFVFGIARLTRGDQDELARKEIPARMHVHPPVQCFKSPEVCKLTNGGN